jgi:hypothetical protein
MAEVFKAVGDVLQTVYSSIIEVLPTSVQKFIAFFIIALGIVIYSIFVWKFYRSIAKKNLINLNLNKYNKSKHPQATKVIAAGLYLLEYALILPILIFIWFTVFTILLIFITEDLPIQTLLIIAATVIASIRMTCYYSQDLSKDIAKLIPFTLLATSLLSPQFFSVSRVFSMFSEIPSLFGEIGIYLFFIILLEVVLRGFDLFFSLFQLEEPIKRKEDED